MSSTHWKSCTLVNVLTGERKDYKTLADASIAIGKCDSYVGMCIRRGKPIYSVYGAQYYAEVRQYEKKEYIPHPRPQNDQLCWECKKAVGGCAWSDFGKPVDGWTAKETKIIRRVPYGAPYTESYKITHCPQFERG